MAKDPTSTIDFCLQSRDHIGKHSTVLTIASNIFVHPYNVADQRRRLAVRSIRLVRQHVSPAYFTNSIAVAISCAIIFLLLFSMKKLGPACT